MKKVLLIFLFLLFVLTRPGSAQEKSAGLIVLCYHDIPQKIELDNFAVDRASFINTIEYLRTHNFHFVSLEDVIMARQGKKILPEKPVLLTFDDAYASYYEFVYPVLQEYRIPSVLAVVTRWLDEKPVNVKQRLMTWDQVMEIAKSDLVEIVSHSHNLHQGVIYNPHGNEDAAAIARSYNVETLTYENEKDYEQRVGKDLVQSKKELEDRLGIKIRAIAWPYGKYNTMTRELAKETGIEVNFSLNNRRTDLNDSSGVIERFLVYRNPQLSYLLNFLDIKPDVPSQQRVVQMDLDMIYDTDPAQVERNLSAVLDRIKDLKVTTVYLQAFADPEGEGSIKEVYFPNSVLPVKSDLFNRVVHQLRTRSQVEVYAWMPMLSYILPDEEKTKTLGVKKYERGKVVDSNEPYQRLSPFSQEAWDVLYKLYKDLAANAAIDGVLFQDDGYLTDKEDFHPRALEEYLKLTGGKLRDPEDLTPEEMQAWTDLKTDRLIALSEHLKEAVRFYRPEARFGRNLYASVLLTPGSEEWFAQNYTKTLKSYDYTVIMAYPYLEKIGKNADAWLKAMVDAAKAEPQGIEKTVFKIQAFDWRGQNWLDAKLLNEWLSTLVGEGARHVGYYPDDFVQDHPKKDTIRDTMSTEQYPFKRLRGI